MIARLRALRALRRGGPERARCAEARRAKARGKSELRRAVRRVTPGQGNLKDSGTENIPPASRRLTMRSGAASRWGAAPLLLSAPGTGAPSAPGMVNRRGAGKGEKVR